MKLGISVVIITYNGAHRIGNTLDALTRQTRPANEVVVVIDGSKDNSREEIEKFSEKLPLKIIETPNQGRAGARNTGAENSSFDLILYLDDDTRPFRNCLEEHWRHHDMNPGCLLVGCILEDPTLFTTDIQKYRITLYDRMGWTRSPEQKEPMSRDNFFLSAANLSLDRRTFLKLDGFEKTLRDHEDFDMGFRALQMGLAMYYIQDYAPVYHDDLITCKSFISRQRQYHIGLKYVYQLRPELFQELKKKSITTIPWYKKTVYFLISQNFIVKMIDNGFMKYMLPQKIRYPFYDHIIQGLVQIYPERKLS